MQLKHTAGLLVCRCQMQYQVTYHAGLQPKSWLQAHSYIEAQGSNCLLILWFTRKSCMPKVGFAIQYPLQYQLHIELCIFAVLYIIFWFVIFPENNNKIKVESNKIIYLQNKKVLSFFLNVWVESADLISFGRPFHGCGPALNECSPNLEYGVQDH